MKHDENNGDQGGMTMQKPVEEGLVDAAILIPLFRGEDGNLRLVIVRRNEGGRHGGQLAFPGGKRDPEDRSVRDTALRETEEETGIVPAAVEILAELPAVETRTTGYRVHPFLARIDPPAEFQRDEREIAEIIVANLAEFDGSDAPGEEVDEFRLKPGLRWIPFYRVGPYKLWGLTYRILRPLIPRITAGEWAL